MRHLLIILLAILALACAYPLIGRGEDKHYMIVFASQTELQIPRGSHTFAVFMKVNADEGRGTPKVDFHCISWLPKSLRIEVGSAEEGRNLTLEETIEWARKLNSKVTMWGPLAIKPEFYELALRQENRLKSNKLSYMALYTEGRGQKVSNCIHALADVDTTREPLDTSTLFGVAASEAICEYFEPWLLDSECPKELCEMIKLKTEGVTVMKRNAAKASGNTMK